MITALYEGTTHTSVKTVTPQDTAAHYGSGLAPVLATPAMIALMENAALQAVLPGLAEGFNTVGVEVHVQHTRATPVGAKVSATATLVQIAGKRLLFEVAAHDEHGEIGRGTHARHIIDTARFMAKIQL
jgi:predicted thioesterase